MYRAFLSLAAMSVVVFGAAAQETPKPIVLALQPPKAASRPLQYPLLVPLGEQRPGNAISDFKEAHKKYKQLRQEDGDRAVDEKLDGWLATPLADLPRKEMAEFFKRYQDVYALVETGARRDYADWEHLEGLRQRGIIAITGEDYGQMRHLITLLNVRIRFSLAEGKVEKALKDLQTGFTMARQVGDAPSLIGFLVGASLAGLMQEWLEEILRQPNVPSLVWPLSDLPTPFLSLRKPLQGERLFQYACLPGMLAAATDADVKPITEKELADCVKMMNGLQTEGLGEAEAKAYSAKLAAAVEKKHDLAKRSLIAGGRSKECVDALPAVQVALLHALLQKDRVFDEMLLAQQLPPWEGWPKVHEIAEKARQDLYSKGDDAPAVSLVKNVPSVVEQTYRVQIRIDRRLALLRVVEALRIYAAAHDGQFPAALKDIKDVPLPLDPRTGKEFEYRLKDGKATLTAPPRGSETNTTPFAFVYELTYQKP